jgi:hypothetical protein
VPLSGARIRHDAAARCRCSLQQVIAVLALFGAGAYVSWRKQESYSDRSCSPADPRASEIEALDAEARVTAAHYWGIDTTKSDGSSNKQGSSHGDSRS